jgi:hypothetical protein
MKKLPIGPIFIGMAIISLIGGLLLMPPKAPAVPTLYVVTAPSVAASPVQMSGFHGVAPSATQTTVTDEGRDPPAHREPGAINYADKGILPPL